MNQPNCTSTGFMAAVFISAGVMTAPALAIEFPIHANYLKPDERIVTGVHALGGGPQTGHCH